MLDEYNRILKGFYPARASGGFTEQNQVFNFVTSLKNQLEDHEAIQWLELPWKEQKQHIDGMVYSPKYKAIFFIEAKRLWNEKKISELQNDAMRLEDGKKSGKVFLDDNFRISKKCKTFKECVEHEYHVLLGDVWLDSSELKRSIPHWWLNDREEAEKLFEGYNRNFVEFIDGHTFDKENIWVKRVEQVQKDGTRYCLLFGCRKYR